MITNPAAQVPPENDPAVKCRDHIMETMYHEKISEEQAARIASLKKP